MTPAPGPGGPPLPSDSVWRVTPPPATPGAPVERALSEPHVTPPTAPPGAVTPAPGPGRAAGAVRPRVGRHAAARAPGAMTPTHDSARTPSPSDPALTLPPRNAPEPAPPAPRPRGRRVAVVASAAVLASAAAAAAVVLPGEDEPPPRRDQAAVAPPVPLEAGPVGLTLPAGWQELAVPVAVPGLRLTDGRAAAPPSGGAVLAGLAPRDAHTPALLSGELLEALGLRSGVVPDREAVRLGDYAAYRYEGLRPRGLGRAVTVYAAPTTAGVATIACIAPLTPADCERAAKTLRVSSASGLRSRPGPRLRRRRQRGPRPTRRRAAQPRRRPPRRPPRAGGQAAAAKRIAADYRAASAALAENAPSPADQGALDELVRATRAAGSAYGDLAAAAHAVGPRTLSLRREPSARGRAPTGVGARRPRGRRLRGPDTPTAAQHPAAAPPTRRAAGRSRAPPTQAHRTPARRTPARRIPDPPDPGPSDPGPSDPGPSDPGPSDPDEGKPEPDPIDPDFGGSEG